MTVTLTVRPCTFVIIHVTRKRVIILSNFYVILSATMGSCFICMTNFVHLNALGALGPFLTYFIERIKRCAPSIEIGLKIAPATVGQDLLNVNIQVLGFNPMQQH